MKILAPLRHSDEVVPLLEAGADEFFCGLTPSGWESRFGLAWANRRAPQSAGVLDLVDFERIISLAGQKPVYAALNAPYYPPGAVDLLADFGEELLDKGAAGLIVADMDLLLALVEAGHASQLHLSSLATCINAASAKFYRDLGLHRIILPRHLTLSEIEAIQIPGVEFETFLLNDGCVFEEGLCATTHAAGAFCTLDGEGTEGIAPETLERYAFWKWTLNHCGCRTGNDYPMGPCGLCAIPRLLRSGIASFKVVGREASLPRKVASVRIAARSLRLTREGARPEEIRQAVIDLRGASQMCEERHLCYYPDLWEQKGGPMLKGLGLFSRHLRGKGLLIAAMFLLGLLGAATSLASPLIGKTFIDSVVGKHNFALVPRIALALIGLAVADLILGACTRLIHTKLSAGVLVEIRERLFAQCLHAPLAEMERFRQGDLLNRFGTDIPKIQTLLVDGVLGFFQNLLFLFVAAAILLNLSIALALWSFLGIFVALLITTAFRRPVERGTRKVRDAMVDLSHFLTERLGALRAVRLNEAQSQDRQSFAACNSALVRRLLKFQTLDCAASGFPALALAASLAWIYLLGGRLIESGSISLGTFVAFILYQGKLVSPAMGILGLVRNLQEARVSLDRVIELLAHESAATVVIDQGIAGAGEIVVEDIAFDYAGAPAVLNGAHLRVASGERVAVFGVSGAGKSTLVQLLFGLRTPCKGRISVGPARSGSRSRLGYAGCEPFLLHATVAENLRYGSLVTDEADLREAALLAEAHSFICGLPDEYGTVIGGRGLALSDGQRQRVGLARLILRNPEILVLDEAFSALDPDTESKVRRNLFKSFHDRTFLVITHRLHGLEDFDRLYLMKEGRIRQVDSRELTAELDGAAVRQVATNLVMLDQVRAIRNSVEVRR